MFRTLKSWTISLTSLAFLFATLSDAHAHVHLCLDGQEPPAAVHVDTQNHLEHHLAQAGTHEDVDVDVPDQAILKAFKVELPTVALPAGWVPPATVRTDSGQVPESLFAFHPSPPPYWRPPLRGPPR